MQELPLKYYYQQNEIACRFLRKPSVNEPLIMTIPGGPCLSGKYLDHFLIQLAAYMNVNVGIVDLPNHDDSNISTSHFSLTYQNCLNMIKGVLVEIMQKCDELILFGQSFGARLAFDLMMLPELKIDKAILTGFPYKFEISKEMQNKINLIDFGAQPGNTDDDAIFINNWKKILPLYICAPLANEVFESLCSNVKTRGNENVLNTVPPLVVSDYMATMKKIVIIQGHLDEVVPNDNLLNLRKLLPHADFHEIEDCGHFPMVEKTEIVLNIFNTICSTS